MLLLPKIAILNRHMLNILLIAAWLLAYLSQSERKSSEILSVYHPLVGAFHFLQNYLSDVYRGSRRMTGQSGLKLCSSAHDSRISPLPTKNGDIETLTTRTTPIVNEMDRLGSSNLLLCKPTSLRDRQRNL
ncbi:RxLR-like protein [Plasmopara halstedii]|uniref:RxLR-like protein n=1 Tax=Plasmopara halstedii TaxID=4781 RepID=A0A0P1AAB0_PLAHL|nr:RxLR-like protein [Plasmopara halstedii]CEG37773.1 RxLR-like protein [Plasmopara halstedii]|eukprot:XP_024574142.1 RxLR-like protein [Plasmopara halstedii]